MRNTQVAIIGGGISGLHTAYELSKQGIDFVLLEARARLGGRIHSLPSHRSHDQITPYFDLGPSWFWPGQQHIAQLINELELHDQVFEQFANGDALYETLQSPIQRGIAGISMAGSYRLNGGMTCIINALENTITKRAGEEALQRNAIVNKLELRNQEIQVNYCVNQTHHQLTAQKTILALPPRVALHNIGFAPDLSSTRQQELNAIATWMAGHAKTVVVYDEPFWRNAGLSGDVISQRGPLSEIHDASPNMTQGKARGSYALFGFFATPPRYRETEKTKIEQAILNQLQRLFGDQALHPRQVLYKDWAQDTLVATERDQHIPNHHPRNQLTTVVEPGWQKRLIWSGSETAEGHVNGYIEGALSASFTALSVDL